LSNPYQKNKTAYADSPAKLKKQTKKAAAQIAFLVFSVFNAFFAKNLLFTTKPRQY
jgi:hypothetical protein